MSCEVRRVLLTGVPGDKLILALVDIRIEIRTGPVEFGGAHDVEQSWAQGARREGVLELDEVLLILGGSKSFVGGGQATQGADMRVLRQADRRGQLNSVRSLYAHSERRQREAAGLAPI